MDGEDRQVCCDWLSLSIVNSRIQIRRHQHLPVAAINVDKLDIDTGIAAERQPGSDWFKSSHTDPYVTTKA